MTLEAWMSPGPEGNGAHGGRNRQRREHGRTEATGVRRRASRGQRGIGPTTKGRGDRHQSGGEDGERKGSKSAEAVRFHGRPAEGAPSRPNQHQPRLERIFRKVKSLTTGRFGRPVEERGWLQQLVARSVQLRSSDNTKERTHKEKDKHESPGESCAAVCV